LTFAVVAAPSHGTLSGTAPNLTYTPAIGYVGADSFTFKANDGKADSNVATISISIANPVATTTAATWSPLSRQYSDRVTFTASVTPPAGATGVPAKSVTFRIGTQAVATAPLELVAGVYRATVTAPLLEPTPFGTAPTGQLKPGAKQVMAVFNEVNPHFSVANRGGSMSILAEDARVTYTGPKNVVTACATCATATVRLSASVKDIQAVLAEAAGDVDPGDIRHATVNFINRTTGLSIGAAAISLPDPVDPAIGEAVFNWNINLGTAASQNFTVGIMVNGYYTRNNTLDNVTVTVSKAK
jgi:hypothetical protein